MKRSHGPNPFAEFFVFVALVGALYMALQALVDETLIASLIPSNASFSWSATWDQLTSGGSGSTQGTQGYRSYGK